MRHDNPSSFAGVLKVAIDSPRGLETDRRVDAVTESIIKSRAHQVMPRPSGWRHWRNLAPAA